MASARSVIRARSSFALSPRPTATTVRAARRLTGAFSLGRRPVSRPVVKAFAVTSSTGAAGPVGSLMSPPARAITAGPPVTRSRRSAIPPNTLRVTATWAPSRSRAVTPLSTGACSSAAIAPSMTRPAPSDEPSTAPGTASATVRATSGAYASTGVPSAGSPSHRTRSTPEAATDSAVAASGVDRVLWLGEPAEGTPVEAYAPDVARTVADAVPGAVLGSSEGAGRVMLGAIAALLQAPVLSGVTALERDGAQVAGTFKGRDPAQHRCLQQCRDRAEHDASRTLRRAEHRSGHRIRDGPRHVGGIRLDGRPFGGLAEPQDTIHTDSGDGLRRRTPAGHHSGHLGAQGPCGHDEPTHGGIVGNHDPRLGRDAHGFPLLSVVC